MNRVKTMNDTVFADFQQYISTISAMDGVHSIYLFGSYANGTPNEKSDIDLLVVIDDKLKADKALLEINKALGLDGMAKTDVLVCGASSFAERSAENRVTLQREIKQNGMLVYAQ